MPIRQRTAPKIERGATFSEGDGKLFRYLLWRIWDASKPLLIFIMLNPSTPTADKNDPTVERCERRARRDGFGGVMVLNIFAFRATDPNDMKAAEDPVGPHNDYFIRSIMMKAKHQGDTLIVAWGSHGRYRDRAREVANHAKDIGVPLYALGLTKSYEPRHPLYLKNDAQLIPWPKMLRLKRKL